jgi:hypothetical protein
MSLITGEDESVTLGAARFRVCIEAAWELEALALLLPKVTANSDEGSHSIRLCGAWHCGAYQRAVRRFDGWIA